MLMLWRHFPPSCAVSQSWKIKKYSKFAEDVCSNPLKGIHTHYIATTLLNTGPEALFFFFFWSICINLVENSLPFYCLLIQTLALTDHGKFLFCLSMPPSSCTGDWEECSEQMCCGRKWMKALLRDWYFPREKRKKKENKTKKSPTQAAKKTSSQYSEAETMNGGEAHSEPRNPGQKSSSLLSSQSL